MGNKSDDFENEEVDIKIGHGLAKELNSQLYQTSAKEGMGIDKLFKTIADSLYSKYMAQEGTDHEFNCRNSTDRSSASFKLHDLSRITANNLNQTGKRKGGGCCK